MHMTSLGRLGPPPQAEGDVFHVSVQQLDAAIKESSFDLRAAVTPNRATYARAKSAKSCPMLIDSRGRILKPNLVEGEAGTLVRASPALSLSTHTPCQPLSHPSIIHRRSRRGGDLSRRGERARACLHLLHRPDRAGRGAPLRAVREERLVLVRGEQGPFT